MSETVYKGRNSPFLVTIETVAGVPYTATQMATITRVRLKVNGEYADSDSHATAFNWTTYAAYGQLVVDIGLIDFTAGTDNAAELIVYDTSYTSGRVVKVLSIIIDTSVYADGTLASTVNGSYGLIDASDVTADGEYSGIIESVTVGETVASVGQVLAFDISTGKWLLAKANAIATMPGTRIALATAAANASCLVLVIGYLRVDTWTWTADDTKKELYVSGATAGALTESAVSTSDYFSQSPALIYSANTIYFHGCPTMVEVA